ncbi:acyl carrier protein phosphodiesterase [Myroides pelagicus]|uniref:DUF479 domain-containing protein n=1 Tax=Myroides pelagicus TaxID=270914 RepID=A0A7K1GNG7_9FLAO|nr:acyl carrier protein phosphodiesterase [Myroides pelagicus]MEC4113615.1 acyl carrier protein phosphodiesterase [Myroides pelagicus]MTH30452.1 DUF479 domain-containing protein [Myroides pelagicus]
MNFLAHIYLSLEDDNLKIGNFIADSVRGKTYLNYPPKIQQGILLHRAIDEYTDFHTTWRSSKKVIVPTYNHYASVLIDMYYDHFLAINWEKYHQTPLATYASEFYTLLEDNFDILPEKVQKFLPIMLSENWLVKYKTLDGLNYILTQMDKRTKNISKMRYATVDLEANYTILQDQFKLFFDELQNYVERYAQQNKLLVK